MTKQFNIRSAKAHAIALKLSRTTGKPLHQVVEEALEALDASHTGAAESWETWQAKLQPTWDYLAKRPAEFRIEDLYDPETGMPA
jgi:hypothetical protein